MSEEASEKLLESFVQLYDVQKTIPNSKLSFDDAEKMVSLRIPVKNVKLIRNYHKALEGQIVYVDNESDFKLITRVLKQASLQYENVRFFNDTTCKLCRDKIKGCKEYKDHLRYVRFFNLVMAFLGPLHIVSTYVCSNSAPFLTPI